MHIASKRAMNLLKWLFGKPKRHNHPAYCIEKTVRVLCMGKQGVGKTSVIQKLCGNEEFKENYPVTIYDDHLKQIIVDECNVSFQFMDLGGSQSFPSMQQVFISQADIYLLFYAVDDAESFNQMLEYRDKITAHKGKHSTELPLLIIRNKVDLKQKRLRKEVERRKTINQWCGKVYDVSAKTGIKINAIMDSLIEESKFIGNDMDRGNMKISGRYLYQENDGKTEFSASEVYHKAPTLFGEKDNSDEKMEKRRRRSLQQQSRKMSMRRTGDTLKRRHSFASFRRKSKEPGIPLWMKEEKEKHGAEESNGDMLSTPIENKRSLDETTFEKTVSKETIESNSPKDSKNTSLQLNTSERRNVFRLSGKKSSVIESTESANSSPAYYQPRPRRKSLSQPDLTLMQEQLNGRTMTSPSLIRKISTFRNKSKPKPEIVHTTLKSEENNEEVIPFTGQPRYRRPSTASRSSRSSVLGRKLSISIDDVSEGEFEPSPPPSRLDSRRRSLSQNDLSLSVQSFNKINNNKSSNIFQRGLTYFDERTPSSLGKKQKNSLPARITDYEVPLPSMNKRWTRSASFNRKKTSSQVYQTFQEHIVEVDEEMETGKLLRRKNSASMTDVHSITESKSLKRKARPKSFDENKNYMNTPNSRSRPPLHKGISFDIGTLKDQSPTSRNWLYG